MQTATTREEAQRLLGQFAVVEYCGFELWETVNGKGYTGNIRMAPSGERSRWPEWEGLSTLDKLKHAEHHRDAMVQNTGALGSRRARRLRSLRPR